MMVINHKGIFLTIAILMVAAALIVFGIFGLRPDIDFTGGTLTELTYPAGRPDESAIHAKLDVLTLGEYSLRLSNDTGVILRTKDLSQTESQSVMDALTLGGTEKVDNVHYTAIGPTIGAELRQKSFEAIGFVLVAIILYIAFAFRKVSKPVSSWKYGIIAILALLHDVSVPIGVFVLLGHFAGVEVGSLFVTALLVVLGYSVHDTIIIFDRIRENLRNAQSDNSRESFETIVGKSLEETYVRSINTSLTVILVLLALFFLGGAAIHTFILALLVGVISGTYSSIFVAPPLLVAMAGKKQV